MKTQQDVIDLLGKPDSISRTPRLISAAWLCSTCGYVHRFNEPKRSPAPCSECGGIVFETTV